MTRPTSPRGSVIFCDDIRIENSGKMILVGTYAQQINIVRQPGEDHVEIGLTPFILLHPGVLTENHDNNLSISLSFQPSNNGDPAIMASGEVRLAAGLAALPPNGLFQLPMPRIGLRFSGDGILSPLISSNDENIPVAGSVEINLTARL